MKNLSRSLKKSNSYRTVFKNANKVVRKTEFRQLLESIIMLLPAIFIFKFLHSIPSKFNIGDIFSKTIIQYYESSLLLLQALRTTIYSLLILLLALICICLILGGLWRILKLILYKISKKTNTNKNKWKK